MGDGLTKVTYRLTAVDTYDVRINFGGQEVPEGYFTQEVYILNYFFRTLIVIIFKTVSLHIDFQSLC